MDYTKSPLLFKIKKGIRYLNLYGLSRTLAKVDAQYHMNRTFDVLPEIKPRSNSKAHVGLLGCGKFGYSNIAYYLNKDYGKVLRACMDVDVNKAVSLHYKWKTDYYTTNAEDIINDQKIDLIYIASNHASHAEYAVKAIEQGKAVHIEKPHAVNTDQLVRLTEAMIKHKGRVRLGFNRPNSKLGMMVSEYLMNEPGETMLNWFVAGHEIEPEHWYFLPEEGGRVLGNLCHWTDLMLQMIPPAARFPIQIHPVRSERSDCDIAVNYIFGDGSIGNITFSAKGHTFEGVRETLNAHKGNVLVNLKDFKEVRIDVVEKVIKKRLWVRDHGHRNAVQKSYKMLKDPAMCEAVDYVWNTGYLVIKTKEALEKFEPLTVQAFEHSYAEEKKLAAVN